MRIGRAAAPLVSRSTFRRAVHLLIGGVALIPYVLLTVGFVQIFAEPDVPYLPMIVLALVTCAIGAIPPFLPAIRSLEIAASRNLLDVDLPEPVSDPPWEARLLGAAWYTLHLLCGGLTLLAILVTAPIAVVLIASTFSGSDEVWRDSVSLEPFDGVEGIWAIVVALVLILAVGYFIAGAGVLLRKLAPFLLGPTPAELRSALEAQAEEFAERNRLARDLHDSVGHALTITTLQAAAARRVMDSDPEFARRAMEAVEETGRAAMEDLDHVLGVLRLQSDTDEARPRRIADLDRLVRDMRAAGVDVAATTTGDLSRVPPAVSREAFRVIQEGLTNAVRHAGDVTVELRVDVSPDTFQIEIENPLPADDSASRPAGGRGLRGMRERVQLLGGEFSAGPKRRPAAQGGGSDPTGTLDGEAWRVHVVLPVRASGTARESAT